MIKGTEWLPSAERLKRLELLILEKRGLRGDTIKVYKTMHDVHKVTREVLFTISHDTKTWGHPLK